MSVKMKGAFGCSWFVSVIEPLVFGSKVFFPLVYLLSVYFMTSQPLSSDRFLMILAVSIGTSSVAQGVGLFVGAAADIQVSRFSHLISLSVWLDMDFSCLHLFYCLFIYFFFYNGRIGLLIGKVMALIAHGWVLVGYLLELYRLPFQEIFCYSEFSILFPFFFFWNRSICKCSNWSGLSSLRLVAHQVSCFFDYSYSLISGCNIFHQI